MNSYNKHTKRSNKTKTRYTYSITNHHNQSYEPHYPVARKTPETIKVVINTPLDRYLNSLAREDDKIILKKAVNLIEDNWLLKRFHENNARPSYHIACCNELIPFKINCLDSWNDGLKQKEIIANRAMMGIIPNDILVLITKYLSIKNIMEMARTCRSFYCLMTSFNVMCNIEKLILNPVQPTEIILSEQSGKFEISVEIMLDNELVSIYNIYPNMKKKYQNIHKAILASFIEKERLDEIAKKSVLNRLRTYKKLKLMGDDDYSSDTDWEKMYTIPIDDTNGNSCPEEKSNDDDDYDYDNYYLEVKEYNEPD